MDRREGSPPLAARGLEDQSTDYSSNKSIPGGDERAQAARKLDEGPRAPNATLASISGRFFYIDKIRILLRQRLASQQMGKLRALCGKNLKVGNSLAWRAGYPYGLCVTHAPTMETLEYLAAILPPHGYLVSQLDVALDLVTDGELTDAENLKAYVDGHTVQRWPARKQKRAKFFRDVTTYIRERKTTRNIVGYATRRSRVDPKRRHCCHLELRFNGTPSVKRAVQRALRFPTDDHLSVAELLATARDGELMIRMIEHEFQLKRFDRNRFDAIVPRRLNRASGMTTDGKSFRYRPTSFRTILERACQMPGGGLRVHHALDFHPPLRRAVVVMRNELEFLLRGVC